MLMFPAVTRSGKLVEAPLELERPLLVTRSWPETEMRSIAISVKY